MKTYPLRCKHCAALLDAAGGLWRRMFGGAMIECAHCGRTCARRDAETMGYSFGCWVDHLLAALVERVTSLPVVALDEAQRAMSADASPERMRMMPNVDMLCSYVTHMFRPVLLEQAHGRECSIEIVGISSVLEGRGDTDAAVGVFGCIEEDAGIREWEATVARVGPTQYVVYAPVAPEGFVGEAVRQAQAGGRARPAGAKAPVGKPVVVSAARGAPGGSAAGLRPASA